MAQLRIRKGDVISPIFFVELIRVLALTTFKLAHPEDISEVVAAGGEDDLVRLDAPPARARERHVHEVAVQLQVAQRRHDVRLVVVPLQAEVLRRHLARLLPAGAAV